ncbi:MAG: hypothetical protein R2761_09890 [Acidimicrobiales bacterium]
MPPRRPSSLMGEDGIVLASGGGNIFNRVVVALAVADLASVRDVVATVGDPGMIRVIGGGEIVEGA